MTLVFMIAAIAVIAVVALLAVGRLGELADVEGDRAPLALPDDRPLDGEDVDGVRFAVGLRGYRMDEVDDVLDRLSDDLAARDARIAELESHLARSAGDPPGSSFATPPSALQNGDATPLPSAPIVAPLAEPEPAEGPYADPVDDFREPTAPVDERPGGDAGGS